MFYRSLAPKFLIRGKQIMTLRNQMILSNTVNSVLATTSRKCKGSGQEIFLSHVILPPDMLYFSCCLHSVRRYQVAVRPWTRTNRHKLGITNTNNPFKLEKNFNWSCDQQVCIIWPTVKVGKNANLSEFSSLYIETRVVTFYVLTLRVNFA